MWLQFMTVGLDARDSFMSRNFSLFMENLSCNSRNRPNTFRGSMVTFHMSFIVIASLIDTHLHLAIASFFNVLIDGRHSLNMVLYFFLA